MSKKEKNHARQAELDETAVFLILGFKQLLFAFDTLNSLEADDPDIRKAFYLNSIYNYIALFFLLHGEGKPMGGTVYPALERHSLTHLLEPMKRLLDEPMGSTTFGEVVRLYRNDAFVHPEYRTEDLDRVYASVDMEDRVNRERFQQLLVALYLEVRGLIVLIIEATGRPLSDFGIIF